VEGRGFSRVGWSRAMNEINKKLETPLLMYVPNAVEELGFSAPGGCNHNAHHLTKIINFRKL
jgi:hypothetical protein